MTTPWSTNAVEITKNVGINYIVRIEILEKNKANLVKFFQGTNQTFELIEIPLPTRKKINNKNIVSSYINFYFSKNKIIHFWIPFSCRVTKVNSCLK